MTNPTVRQPDYPVDSLFVDRWSPRSFDGTNIADDALMTVFEAARWAPSSFNRQPWRFVYAKRSSPDWPSFLDALIEGNRGWAQHASALVFVIAQQRYLVDGEAKTNGAASFDCGAAWASLAFQASLSGLSTHAMGGFDRAKAREVIGLPDGYTVEVAVAIGRRGDVSSLPPALQARELPNGRNPLGAMVSAGRFTWQE